MFFVLYIRAFFSFQPFHLKKKTHLFIYFWLRWVFVAAHGLSLVVASGGLLLLQSTGSRRTGLVALRHVGSSQTRAQTCVPCIGRRLFNHCTTREVPNPSISQSFNFSKYHIPLWHLEGQEILQCSGLRSFLGFGDLSFSSWLYNVFP